MPACACAGSARDAGTKADSTDSSDRKYCQAGTGQAKGTWEKFVSVCDSNIGSCDAGTFLDTSKKCAGGYPPRNGAAPATCEASDKAACCTAMAACDDIFFSCDAGTSLETGKKCAGATCKASDKAACCTAEAACDSNIGSCERADEVLDRSKKCAGATCKANDKWTCCSAMAACDILKDLRRRHVRAHKFEHVQ